MYVEFTTLKLTQSFTVKMTDEIMVGSHLTTQVLFHNRQCYSNKDLWTTLSPAGLTMTHSVNCNSGHVGQVHYAKEQ